MDVRLFRNMAMMTAIAYAMCLASHAGERERLLGPFREKLLEKGHRGVKMTQEEMDKIVCWIDLAVPHSGTWTEGMMADDEAVYLRVRKLRDAWQREETANIAAYLESQKTRKGENP